AGRDVVVDKLPRLKSEWNLDFVVVNAENSASGFGLTDKICKELKNAGADVMTTGSHVWDQREFMSQINQFPYVVRPLNYPAGTPGKGVVEVMNAKGQSLVVVNVMGRLFMDAMDDPFAAMNILNDYPLRKNRFVLVDVHAEATSEKMAMGHFSDGKASLVVGPHTHIPTAAAQILDVVTAYQTDAGMCGDYNSVIGMKKDIPIQRFTRKLPTERFKPAMGDGTLCGVFVETDDESGLAREVKAIRLGPRLENSTLD